MRNKLLLVLLIVGLSGSAQATLIDRGSGMVYDDVLDITWLSDANMGGSMNWGDSMNWASNLLFGGFDDWRLASVDVNMDNSIIDCNNATELACRDNELGYMFYQNLMGSFGDSLTGTQGLFTNIQPALWSGTVFATRLNFVWDFDFASGSQFGLPDFVVNGAWAVRSGDVMTAAMPTPSPSPTPAPEPGTSVLLGLGLAGLVFARRRDRSSAR
jgi:hypothetical protein